MRVTFPKDQTCDNQSVVLELPEAFLLEDGSPYRWFDQYRYVPNIEPMLRSCVSALIATALIDPARNILDSGAFIGDNALPWTRLISGTVFAIDPSPNNIRLIETIAETNGITNIRCL